MLLVVFTALTDLRSCFLYVNQHAFSTLNLFFQSGGGERAQSYSDARGSEISQTGFFFKMKT